MAPPRGLKSKRAATNPRPFLRFHHSEALRTKTLALLDAIENARDATEHRDALSDLVMELTSSGMDYYYLKPLKLAKPGFIVEQTAKLGLAGVQQIMAPVIGQVIGRMNRTQLLSVCDSMRRLML